jgi:hypothetical protein
MRRLSLILTTVLTGAYGFAQTSNRIIVTLNNSTDKYDLYVNDRPYYTIKKEEKFYYYPDNENACTINRSTGKVPKNLITPVSNVKYLKFKFQLADIKLENFHEDKILAERLGWNYQEVVSKASQGDGFSLKKLLTLEQHVDGGATEMFADRFFKIVHFWKDSELADLATENKDFARNFLKFFNEEFYTGFTEKEINDYMTLFFPKTWNAVNK